MNLVITESRGCNKYRHYDPTIECIYRANTVTLVGLLFFFIPPDPLLYTVCLIYSHPRTCNPKYTSVDQICIRGYKYKYYLVRPQMLFFHLMPVQVFIKY